MSNDDFLHSCIYRKVYLHEKSTTESPKILLLVSKPKTEVVFFLSALTLNWRHSWKSASAEALTQRIKLPARYQMRVLSRKSKVRTALASSWTCLQRPIISYAYSLRIRVRALYKPLKSNAPHFVYAFAKLCQS